MVLVLVTVSTNPGTKLKSTDPVETVTGPQKKVGSQHRMRIRIVTQLGRLLDDLKFQPSLVDPLGVEPRSEIIFLQR